MQHESVQCYLLGVLHETISIFTYCKAPVATVSKLGGVVTNESQCVVSLNPRVTHGLDKGDMIYKFYESEAYLSGGGGVIAVVLFLFFVFWGDQKLWLIDKLVGLE